MVQEASKHPKTWAGKEAGGGVNEPSSLSEASASNGQIIAEKVAMRAKLRSELQKCLGDIMESKQSTFIKLRNMRGESMEYHSKHITPDT